MTTDDVFIPRLPVNSDCVQFNDWHISYKQSHILKSICSNNNKCIVNDVGCCDLCTYSFALEIPSLPDMVFHKNNLLIEHKSGARLEFTPMEALKRIKNVKLDFKVACAEEWRETRLVGTLFILIFSSINALLNNSNILDLKKIWKKK